ncbi:Proteophosphoglycan ppg4 [Rhodotorula diobovata]|uniref:Proteophosphoglycan ppg4 n=1 Tax=Rhodotorula diobovata TaxID=5288 RepID=A0A5C5FRP3_9BASI|nr:Proteophosphoglycan ppg4 [Rhodotorula diobovata]
MPTIPVKLAPDQAIQLTYRDGDGDDITLSTDVELREYLESAQACSFILRLPSHTAHSGVATTLYSADAADVDDWEFEDGKDDDKEPVTSKAPVSTNETASTPTLLDEPREVADAAAADPEETPLAPAAAAASVAERTQALIDAEFPTSTSTNDTSAAADPIDEPLPHLPNSGSPDMPFTGLPSSFASLLSGLPSHAGALGTHVSSLLSSPQSALGRLSALAADPMGAGAAALDLSDLGRSVAQLSAHLSDAAREVVEGVRKEADAVRGEFEELKAEVAREKSRFEDEVRRAMEQAKETPSPFAPRSAAATAPREASEEYEMHARGAPEEPYVQRTGTGPAPSLAERMSREERRCVRERRRQEKEARREARRAQKAADKAARKEAKLKAAQAAGATAAPVAVPTAESKDVKRDVSSSSLFEGSMSTMPGSLPTPREWAAATNASVSNSAFYPRVGQEQEHHDDDDKPVLLTNFLLACDELGMDVSDPRVRIALTDTWCDLNGRGLSRMVARALDEFCERE